MNTPRAAIAAVVLAILIALHFTLRPLLDWRAGVDFLVIGVLIVAVRVRPGSAAIVGFLLGLMLDAMNPEGLGSATLAMTLVGFTASRLKAAFFADDLALNAVFIFLGKLSFDVIATIAEGRLSGKVLLWQMLAWTPLAALVTAAVGVVLMAVVRPALDERRGR